MMGLFSRPLGCIQVLALCLGSWGVLSYGADAQEESRPGSESVFFFEDASARLAVPLSDLGGGELPTVSVSASDLELPPEDFCVCLPQDGQNIVQAPADEPEGRGINLDGEDDDDDELESPVQNQPSEPVSEPGTDGMTGGIIDDELGILRLRSQPVGIDSELGILRIRPTEDVPLEVEPAPTRQNSVFLTGRASVYGGNNLFRTPDPIGDRIYQTGIGVFAFPRLSERTNLVLSAEANLARYEDLSVVDYNEIQFQAGIRQRLSQRSYGQLNWRYQDLSTPGSDSFFNAHYIELLLSRRDILNNRTWVDSYYQARLSMSEPTEFSRFTQIGTGSLNYGFDTQTRVSLLYQLFIDDYTEISRHDTYHQVIAQVSHDLSSTTRLSLFAGFRFGRSSLSTVNFDDTIYGASVNVNLPLF